MNYEQFLEQMKEDLQARFAEDLPPEYADVRIGIRDVEKLQGESYRGLSFRSGDSPIEANLNMTGVFQAYEAGRPYEDILEEVEAQLMKVVDRTPNFDIGELTDYEALKPKLMMEVIPQKGNEDRLENIPHQNVEDMALIYRLDMGDSAGGKITFIITNQQLKAFGITAEQLHQDALEKAPLTHPASLRSMQEVADIKTSDQLDLPVPDAKFETVVVQPSEIQKDMVASLSERAARVHSGSVDPSVDNMLKITSDGRKIGLDQRLMNPLLPDDPGSKLNACVNNVLNIWEDGKDRKLTQLVFCDLSTPKNDGTFNVYDDIKTKLMASGVPAAEIAFIHDADTEAKKKELFAKVRTGQVRVLLGSTQKMGAGTNAQDRLIAVHHLDVGWRPADMTQRNGRIIRQGNQNPEVKVFQYVTEGTFEAYLYQTLENKQKFISQIMTSKSPVRSCDVVDEQTLSYAEIKALCAGNPLIREKMDLDVDVARLKVLKADHQSKQYRLEDKLLKYFPAEIERNKGYITGFQRDLKTVEAHPLPKEDFVGMEVKGRKFMDKEAAGEAILAVCKEYKGSDAAVPIGSYRGFAMELTYDSFWKDFEIILKGSMSHRATLGTDARGNITRLDNCLAAMSDRMQKVQDTLDNLYQQQAAAKEESGKPFPQEEELREKSARLAELDAALNMDERDVPVAGEDLSDVAEVAETKAAYGKPSVLAQLKEKMEQAAGEPHHNRSREAVAL